MSKKDFTKGIDSLIREIKPEEERLQATPAPKVAGGIRATFIVNETTLNKLRAVSYYHRIMLKDIVGVALNNFIERYEEKHGAIKERPGRREI